MPNLMHILPVMCSTELQTFPLRPWKLWGKCQHGVWLTDFFLVALDRCILKAPRKRNIQSNSQIAALLDYMWNQSFGFCFLFYEQTFIMFLHPWAPSTEVSMAVREVCTVCDREGEDTHCASVISGKYHQCHVTTTAKFDSSRPLHVILFHLFVCVYWRCWNSWGSFCFPD